MQSTFSTQNKFERIENGLNLRFETKLLKAKKGISYKEIAEYIEISQRSFYNWLNGQYELSEQKEKRLKEVIETLC